MTVDKTPSVIKKMFDELAPNYDFMNSIISFGLHFFVKEMAVKKLEIPKNAKVLDLCSGTGDLAKIFASYNKVQKATAVDFSLNMTELARKKNLNPKVECITADCLDLPFENESFDIVSIAFGLRNIENYKGAIKEMKRVLKQGGKILYIDFSLKNEFLNSVFKFFVTIFSTIFVNKQKKFYEYLISSKNEFCVEPFIISSFEAEGFYLKKNYDFLFGSICVQIYEK